MKHVISFLPMGADFNTATQARDGFWETGLGSVMSSFLGVFGLLIVVYSILRTIKKVAEGKIGEAVKGVLGAAVISVFLFQPSLINTTIESLTGVVKSALETVSEIGGSDGSSTPGSGTTPAGDTPAGEEPFTTP
jgi:hypothetical protein